MTKAKIIETLKIQLSTTAREMYRTTNGDTHNLLDNCKQRGRYYGLLTALSLHGVNVFATPHFDGEYFYVTNWKFSDEEGGN